MHRLAEQTHPAFPVTIYYAFKQSESDDAEGTEHRLGYFSCRGDSCRLRDKWHLADADRGSRSHDRLGTNALASSIILVCRPRAADASTATRREFVTALKAELPQALAHLQRGNIAPVDLAQAAIGPGMAVYTRYARVLDAEGNPLSVREALALINQTLDEALAEQEGDFDADSRWALTWFEQAGSQKANMASQSSSSKSKNTSVAGMVEAGILESKRGKVRLLQPDELPAGLGPRHRSAPQRLGNCSSPDPRTFAATAKEQQPYSSQFSALRPRSPVNWPTASMCSASARSAQQRLLLTTASCRVGPKSSALPARA